MAIQQSEEVANEEFKRALAQLGLPELVDYLARVINRAGTLVTEITEHEVDCPQGVYAEAVLFAEEIVSIVDPEEFGFNKG